MEDQVEHAVRVREGSLVLEGQVDKSELGVDDEQGSAGGLGLSVKHAHYPAQLARIVRDYREPNSGHSKKQNSEF